MQKVFVTVAVGLVLNLPSTTLGQTEPPADSANLIELRIGGAVRNGGLYNVDRTLTTISDVLTMAGRAAPQGNGDKVWVVPGWGGRHDHPGGHHSDCGLPDPIG